MTKILIVSYSRNWYPTILSVLVSYVAGKATSSSNTAAIPSRQAAEFFEIKVSARK